MDDRRPVKMRTGDPARRPRKPEERSFFDFRPDFRLELAHVSVKGDQAITVVEHDRPPRVIQSLGHDDLAGSRCANRSPDRSLEVEAAVKVSQLAVVDPRRPVRTGYRAL